MRHGKRYIVWGGAHHFLQECMCAQRRLRSACTSSQVDQNLRCSSEDDLDRLLSTNCLAKTLIKLCACADWFEFFAWRTCTLAGNVVLLRFHYSSYIDSVKPARYFLCFDLIFISKGSILTSDHFKYTSKRRVEWISCRIHPQILKW